MDCDVMAEAGEHRRQRGHPGSHRHRHRERVVDEERHRSHLGHVEAEVLA